MKDGKAWRMSHALATDKARRDALRERSNAERLDEASDKYATCWRAPNLLVLERRKGASVWVPADAPGARD